MGDRRRFYIVDAFSDTPFRGNPAVVVPDANGMSDAAMQALAAELRMEAGFVLPPTHPDADLRMRFFSPGAEVDVSGHVTVAAYAALAAAGKLPLKGAGRVRQEARAGVLSVDLAPDTDAGPWVTLDFGRPTFGQALDRGEVASALRAADEALLEGHAPRAVTCGVALGVTAMTDLSALEALAPDMVKLTALSRRRGVLGMCCYARPGVDARSALAARFFFPVVGPDEDAVSGAALAAICAYAVRERHLVCVGETQFQTDQGHSLGRPSRAHVIVRAEGGQIASIRVRGQGVIVAEGTLW
jgi:PhzF family phenazine biosynthesis protein